MSTPVNDHFPDETGIAPGQGLVVGNGERAFGGSTLALLVQQAAQAASEGQRPHSLHAHFLAPAAPARPLTVVRHAVTTSPSFTTASLHAMQGGHTVASATVSFHRPRPSPEHAACTDVPSGDPGAAPHAEGGALPHPDHPARRDFEFRAADPVPPAGTDSRPVLRFWVRHRGPLQDTLAQATALTWASDLCLTRVADLEHETRPGVRRAASLDHALWFHRPFDLTQWLLYETTSPAYADALAFSTGRFFADGLLVASVAQQSLLRRLTTP